MPPAQNLHPAPATCGGRACCSSLFAVFFSMRLTGVVRMITSMSGVAGGRVGMVSGFLVMATIVMLSGFVMMPRGLRMVFRRLTMMFSCFLGHKFSRVERSMARCPTAEVQETARYLVPSEAR